MVLTRTGILRTSYSPRQAAYDLKKLRAKNLIRSAARWPRYETSPDGLRTITALHVLREKVIRPVLTGAARKRPGRPPKNPNLVDQHYARIQRDFCGLFDELGIAAALTADR